MEMEGVVCSPLSRLQEDSSSNLWSTGTGPVPALHHQQPPPHHHLDLQQHHSHQYGGGASDGRRSVGSGGWQDALAVAAPVHSAATTHLDIIGRKSAAVSSEEMAWMDGSGGGSGGGGNMKVGSGAEEDYAEDPEGDDGTDSKADSLFNFVTILSY